MKQPILISLPNHSIRVASLLFALLMSVICFPDSVLADYVEGRVRVMRAEGPTVEVTTNGARVEVTTGTELTQGTAIRTGASGEVDLMFDNGGVLEIKPSTEFLIEKFEREPFDPSGVDYKTIPEEPTSSKTKLKVDTGVILMGVKKLKPSSEFQIETPVGMTGIRGTSLFVKYDKAKPEEGTIVGVTEGKVEFLTPTGTNQPINAGESFGITDSPTGATIKPNPPGASVLMAETRGVDQAIRQTAPAKSFESAPVTTGGDASLDVAPIKPEMIKVEGGSLPKESRVPNKTVKAFEIGKYEVTWGEWQQVRDWAVTKGYDLQNVGKGLSENHPVTEVSWYDAVKWCNAKSEMNRVEPVYRVNGKVYKTGKTEMKGADAVTQKTGARGFRLPTDSEWEWAARGGSESKGHIYSGSNDLNAVGWFKGNSRGKPLKPGQKDPQELGKDKARLALPFYPVHSVGQKSPNELGIYDMSGNVVEWTWDPKNNVRGGCARDPQEWNKLDLRSGTHLDYADCYLGFRLARSL